MSLNVVSILNLVHILAQAQVFFTPAHVHCCAFVSSESTCTHRALFLEINKTVKQDTGDYIKWQHLNSVSTQEHTGIRIWMADAHEGQAQSARTSPAVSIPVCLISYNYIAQDLACGWYTMQAVYHYG